MNDPNEKVLAGLTRYEILVNAIKRVADEEGEWDDVDPYDGLHDKSIRSFAQDALRIIGEY